MLKVLIKALEGIPYGFPIGWVAARAAEGDYRRAAIDTLACISMIGVLLIWDMKHTSRQEMERPDV